MTAKPELDHPALVCQHCGSVTPDPIDVQRCPACGVTAGLRALSEEAQRENRRTVLAEVFGILAPRSAAATGAREAVNP